MGIIVHKGRATRPSHPRQDNLVRIVAKGNPPEDLLRSYPPKCQRDHERLMDSGDADYLLPHYHPGDQDECHCTTEDPSAAFQR